ncbi:MAG: hypothetical protein SGI73_08260 [Chloroflexota bacterium]|nr:hypothetical protein [Chloroflexota bacterium]
MKINRVVLVLALLFVLVGRATDVRAQLRDGVSRVLFIDDPALQSAAPTNEDADGVSRFATLFRDLGAEILSAPLTAPLPDAEIIVLARPRRALTSDELARLWLGIERGANVLLALEPGGQVGITGETPDRGIARLLLQDYGLELRDGFLVTRAFTAEIVRETAASFIAVSVEPGAFANPDAAAILAPLAYFDIAVVTWGARSVRTDAIGVDSRATPLLFTEGAYGEADRNIFRESDPAPLNIDYAVDAVGRLFVAGIGENARIANRVALLTDGDMLLNGFGLATDADGKPEQIGNTIFAGRLAAWLLELPAESYPALPSGYTYLHIDGDASDWYGDVPPNNDPGSDFPNARYNLRSVRAFHNDQSLYVLIETAAPPDPASQIGFSFDVDDNGTPERFVTIDGSRFFLQSEGTVGVLAAGRGAFGAAVELRLPLAFVGTVFSVCISAPDGALSAAAAASTPDCSDVIRAVNIPERDLPSAPSIP